ncbi:T9SS type A sorting domain-containing protein [Cryomorpha ignava]|uniref:T9SS type A sorting domain-containing protein n=1 Tax=Cryomorpha ignava TaxID=101383 RepID=A0A7K3WVA1_9FLAO|nr:T9SS type A sorting domain-containing protein [Cryomorpha ignava]NEN25619.1 T9SS type A sorting domain-containing protein [Cryomorpha ignava]
MFDDWWMPMEWTGHFAHEYGHALGIHHTYNGEYTTTTHFDFLDDVFGTCVEPILTDPNHPCYDNFCNPSSNQICHLKACFWFQHTPPYPLLWGGMVDNEYISPKMSGRFHRALSLYDETFFSSFHNKFMNRYVKEEYSYSIPKEINQDETWDFAIKMYQDIIVKAGNTLTISCEVKMPIQGKIIIEPNATLIVDGGRITSAHDDLWQGIEVWGNYNMPQTSANQGRLIVKNDAIIENAENAVTLWKSGDWAKTGGFVEAYNSTFKNNRRSIEFRAYKNEQSNGFIAPNRSIFKNCTFETDNDLLLGDIQGNQSMFTMHKVNGVRILGCDFIYNRTVTTYSDLKNAINTSDANFRVDNTCNIILPLGEPCPDLNTKHSTFTGFNNAIHVTSATWNVGPEIKDAVFSKNMVGINFDAVTAPAAIFNEFTVGNNPFFAQDDAILHLGIKVNNCDEYIVEENEFTGSDSLGWTTHGVFTLDGTYSSNSNEIYKNEYTGVSSGTIATGFHGDPSPEDNSIGLRFICNENQNNINDFEVRPFNGNPSEISNYQNGGEPGIPAGNTFSAGTSNDNVYTHLDFYSDAAYVYMMNTNDINPDEDEIFIAPGTITLATVNTQNTCATNYPASGGGLGSGLTYGKLKTDREAYNNLYYPYLQLIDAGNTQGMISEIELSWPNDAWTLHDELMTRSPYNSETVLIAAADKNILTHGMLLEILLANPDVLRSGNVIRHVGEIIANPMPQYMIDILIEAARDPNTVRSGMEKNLSNLHLEMIRTHKRISHKLMNDSVAGFHPDTLIKYFSSVRSLTGRYQQIYAYTGLHQYINALAVVDSISLHYKLSSEQISELDNTEDFLYFLKAVNDDVRDVDQLTQSEINDLKLISMVEPGGSAAERAENILCFFYDKCAAMVATPKNNGAKIKKPSLTKKSIEEVLNSVRIAPNPANLYVEFEFEIFKSSKDNTLRIIDIQGKPIKSWNLGINQQGIKVLDTRKLPNGVYFYELLQDGSKLKGGKFIIQH